MQVAYEYIKSNQFGLMRAFIIIIALCPVVRLGIWILMNSQWMSAVCSQLIASKCLFSSMPLAWVGVSTYDGDIWDIARRHICIYD